MEALQHRRDRFPAGMGSEEAVFIGSVFGEQQCEAAAVIFCDGGGKGSQQAGEGQLTPPFGSCGRYGSRGMLVRDV
jgi:hypothetical protein